MALHPKFRIVNISSSPNDAPLFQIEIGSSAGPAVRYRDEVYRSVGEAEAAILALQARGVFPSNDDLNGSDWR